MPAAPSDAAFSPAHRRWIARAPRFSGGSALLRWGSHGAGRASAVLYVGSPPAEPPSSWRDPFDSMTDATHTLNALGLLCPLPLLFAVRDMTRLAPGEVLELVGDDPGLLEDVPTWCARAGHELLEMDEEEGVIVCRIAKGAPPTAPPEGA